MKRHEEHDKLSTVYSYLYYNFHFACVSLIVRQYVKQPFLLTIYSLLPSNPRLLATGRWGLPLVGYVPLPGPTLKDHLINLNKKHGDIYM